jgi:4-hydroxybenzoate polyprenyltransferase
MLIMPLIDFYATACDWLQHGNRAPTGLYWFVVVSFFNGIVIEIGRKIRASEDEETGVATYTVIWGKSGAIFAWFLALLATAASAIQAGAFIQFAEPTTWVLGFFLILNFIAGLGFLQTGKRVFAKWIEPLSALWTVSMYLILGAIPLLWRWWQTGGAR